MHDDAIDAAILTAVAACAPGRTICPSQVARAQAGDWRPLMGPVRAAAARLQARGQLAVTQGGRPVDAAQARGPIRLGRPAGDA